jgi:TPR repeat protein
MTEKLPIAAKNQELDNFESRSGSLLGRGLDGIKNKNVTINDLDDRYRQARNAYNQITAYGEETCFSVYFSIDNQDIFENPLLKYLKPFNDQMKKLEDIFCIFQELANSEYGKVFFPLSSMYKLIMHDNEKSHYYANKALTWLINNCDNDPELQNDLADIYYFKTDYQKAALLYQKSAEGNYAKAEFNLGLAYTDGFGVNQNYQQALYHLKIAADMGYSMAQYQLAWMYEEGIGANQNYEEAIFWYKKSAAQNYRMALGQLGWMYKFGRGVEQNYQESAYWYKKAAELGSAKSQYQLAWAYEEGLGVNIDHTLFMFWYTQSAERGYVYAQSRLGWMYLDGIHTESNNKIAMFWLSEAAKQGDEKAQHLLNILGANGNN